MKSKNGERRQGMGISNRTGRDKREKVAGDERERERREKEENVN